MKYWNEEKQLNREERIRKILSWRPDMRLTAVGAVLLLVITMIPLLRLAIYAAPWYDDYMYGGIVRNFMLEDYSLLSALKGALYGVKTEWFAFQGTFSSVFIMSMEPMIWGDQYYFLGPVFLIVILAFSVYLLVRTVASCLFRTNRLAGIALSAFASTMVLMLIYSAQSGFYWYNGGVHYVGMHSFLLLLAVAWIRILTQQGNGKGVLLLVWSIIGAVLAGGANYVTTLQGLLFGLSCVAVGIWFRNKRVLRLMPSMLVYCVAFYINISAPGNNVRQGILGKSGIQGNVVLSVVCSFVEAFRHLWTLTGWITVVIMVMLVPLIWYIVKHTNFEFRYPGLVLIWSICLYASGFTPGLFALGSIGLSRILNAVKITFQLLLLFNEIYWIGYFYQHIYRKGKNRDEQIRPCVWWFYPVIGAVILLVFCMTENQAGSYSSYGAYYYVHTGEAFNFHQEYLERVKLLESGGPDVVVKPYRYKPWFLCAGELSDNPDAEQNRAIAKWYLKNSVVCVEDE